MEVNDPMTTDYIISRLRNPYGLTDESLREVRLSAAKKIDELVNAYENLKRFAIESGLDVTTYGRGA